MNNIVNKLVAAFALAVILTMTLSAYSDGVNEDLSGNLIRLHIIANSDSDEDQAVKLKVRDEILAQIGEKFNGDNLESSRENIIDSLDEIEDISNRVLKENGFSYGSKAQYGKFPFPTKHYSDISLPAGDYYGVRVVLGKGEGHNWWCVLYPPLCPTEKGMEISQDGKEKLRENLCDNSYDIINGGDVKVKFKTVEICQQVKAYLERR